MRKVTVFLDDDGAKVAAGAQLVALPKKVGDEIASAAGKAAKADDKERAAFEKSQARAKDAGRLKEFHQHRQALRDAAKRQGAIGPYALHAEALDAALG